MGGALEHGQVAGGLGDFRDGLHAGRAGADHRDALAREAHRLLRPVMGVAGLALGVATPGMVGMVAADSTPMAVIRKACGVAPAVLQVTSHAARSSW